MKPMIMAAGRKIDGNSECSWVHTHHRSRHNQNPSGRGWLLWGSYETRKKISEAQRGIPLSKEHRRSVSEGQRGKVLSEEHRRKISET